MYTLDIKKGYNFFQFLWLYFCIQLFMEKTLMKFYLVLIKKNGDIIHNIFASSHDDLIEKYITPDDIENKTFFRATYSPKEGSRLDDLDDYRLVVEETFIPEWFNGAFQDAIIAKLNQIIFSMIIKGRRNLLLNEGAILTKNAHIDEIKYSVIFAMYDNSKIKSVDNGSEIHLMTDDTYIDAMYDSTKIIEMNGYAKVKEMYKYSKIMKMSQDAKVGKMYENSRIVLLKGDANIDEMHETSKADRLAHMSKVMEMHGHTVIEEMRDWSIVEKMYDNARINHMCEDSKVIEMYGESMIEIMTGNSIVEKLYENSLVRKLENMAAILEKELKK